MNETQNNDDQNIQLTDLSLSDEQAEAAKGGKGGPGHLILPVANTYTGTTTVTDEALSMNYQRKSGEVQ